MKDLDGFKTHYPKIGHLRILKSVSWKSLRKWQEGHFDLTQSCPTVPWEPEIILPFERHSSCTRREEGIVLIRDREFGGRKSGQTNLVKLTLIFLAATSPFAASSPNPFVLSFFTYLWFLGLKCLTASSSGHFYRASLSWEESHVHIKKISKMYMLFSCLSVFVSLILDPVRDHKRVKENFPPL